MTQWHNQKGKRRGTWNLVEIENTYFSKLFKTCVFIESYYWTATSWQIQATIGTVVMGGDSWSRGHELKSRHSILHGSFFTYICCKICAKVWIDQNKWKIRRGGWPIFLKKCKWQFHTISQTVWATQLAMPNNKTFFDQFLFRPNFNVPATKKLSNGVTWSPGIRRPKKNKKEFLFYSYFVLNRKE